MRFAQAGFADDCVKAGSPPLLIGARHDEMQPGVLSGDLRKRVDEQITPLLPVDAAEIENVTLAT